MLGANINRADVDKKTCFKCSLEKALSEFYPHPEMADGRLGKCKECARKDVSKNYRSRRGYYAEYERKRFTERDRKIAVKRYAVKRRTTSPEKYRAAYLTSNAIRDGRLIRKPCEVCEKIKSEAHHEDYSKPFDVVWLCRKHHLERHGKVAF